MLRKQVEVRRQVRSCHRVATDWLEPSLSGDRREARRTPVSLTARHRRSGALRSSVSVTDISISGCCVLTALDVPAGSYCWIILPTLESLYSRVAWCRDERMGLDFAEPLHAAVAKLLIKRSSAQPT